MASFFIIIMVLNAIELFTGSIWGFCLVGKNPQNILNNAYKGRHTVDPLSVAH